MAGGQLEPETLLLDCKACALYVKLSKWCQLQVPLAKQ
jgi:hypothetical protein